MPKDKIVHHYAIIYKDESKTGYTIFDSANLDVLAQIYALILQFESMFHTFPNASCHIELEEDFNYDEDCGAWDMSYIINPKWSTFVEEIKHDYGSEIGDIIDPTSKHGGNSWR